MVGVVHESATKKTDDDDGHSARFLLECKAVAKFDVDTGAQLDPVGSGWGDVDLVEEYLIDQSVIDLMNNFRRHAVSYRESLVYPEVRVEMGSECNDSHSD